MRVREISFQGYKAYGGDGTSEHFQRLALAPLTLIFGKNNSGKSAALRLPRLLLGGLECNDGHILPVSVRGLRYGAGFLDLVHGGDFFGRPSFRFVADHGEQTLDLEFALFSRNAFTADEPPHIWSYEMRSPEKISIVAPPQTDGGATEFAGLLPRMARWDDWRKAAGTLLDGMIHIGPTRTPILPTYPNEQPGMLGHDGSGAPQLLHTNSPLAEATGAWYEKHMEGWRLLLKRDNDSFSLRITRSSKLSTNLAHGGEGLQQVLPVVIHQLWRQQSNADEFLDIVEQPELHLHAAAQAPLADLFIDTALQGRGQVLVETHSEPLLLRVQRRVAEGLLSPDQIALYFVEMTASGSYLRQVHLNDEGEIDWWPDGVFEEDFHEIAAIRRAQRARRRFA